MVRKGKKEEKEEVEAELGIVGDVLGGLGDMLKGIAKIGGLEGLKTGEEKEEEKGKEEEKKEEKEKEEEEEKEKKKEEKIEKKKEAEAKGKKEEKGKEKEKEEKEDKGEKIASEVLGGIGNIIPGFSGLLKCLEKSDVFQKRLEEVDKEIKAKLKGRPLNISDIKVHRGFTIRTIRPLKSKSSWKVPKKPTTPVKEIKPEELKAKEQLIDIFDEENELRIVTVLPDVKEEDIEVKLDGKLLTITADSKQKEVALPCEVKKEIEKTYKNNILEIRLKK